MKKNFYFLLVFCLINVVTQAQHSLITPQGTSFPRLSLSSTTDVVTVPSPTVSQLVYNINASITGAGADGAGYYFWNGTNWKKIAIGPVSAGGGSLPSSGIILSETEMNTELTSNGFSLKGKINNLSFQNYSPSTPTLEWNKNTSNYLNGRIGYSACMLNNKMFIWGGSTIENYYNTGGLYSFNDTWAATSTANIVARSAHSTVCYDSKAIVWGGFTGNGSGLQNTGNKYDANTNTWQAISSINAPSARSNNTVIWTGTKMIIWGGNGTPTYLNSGASYDPVTDTWTSISATNAPAPRTNHSAIWTGSKMIIWGGAGTSTFGNGGIYDPATDSWTNISTNNAPVARYRHSAIWTGSKMVIIGGYDQSGYTITGGGMYDPATDTWTTIYSGTTYGGQFYTVLLNNKILIVTPIYLSNSTLTELFDPVSNSWQTIPSNAFSPQRIGSLVSDGNSVISWGGYSYENSTYNYYSKGSILSLIPYQAPQSTNFYLFKKD